MQPTPPFIVLPGTENWAQQYGVVGTIAAIALVAIAIVARSWLTERREDRQRIIDLTAKLVESGQTSHRESLGLVVDLQKQNDERYGALLERHTAETGRYAEALREQSAATTAALSGLVKKISASARGPD